MRFIALLAVALVAGCTPVIPPGPTFEQSSDAGLTKLTNQPPGAIGVREQDLNWVATGTASLQATRVTKEGISRIGNGPAARQILYDPKSGTFVLSSETRFGIKEATVFGEDGKPRYQVKGLETDSAEPTNALAGTLAAWAPSFEKLSGDQKELVISAIKERQETIRQASPLAAGVLGDLIKALMVP